MTAYMAVHEKIQNEKINQVRWYRKDPIPEAPVPILGGPDLIDPRQVPEISAAAQQALAAEAESVAAATEAEPAAES